jgi:hypothetical protein
MSKLPDIISLSGQARSFLWRNGIAFDLNPPSQSHKGKPWSSSPKLSKTQQYYPLNIQNVFFQKR